MMLAKLAVWARKIHRFLVLLAAFDALILMITGIKLHASLEGETIFPFIALSDARWLHGQLTLISVALLGIMTVTGVYLYLFPWLSKITRKS